MAAGLLAKAGLPMPLVAAAACLVGAVLGGLNGALVAYVRIPSIVVTLATMVALRDGLRWATDGAWIQDLPADFQWLGLSQAAYPFVALGTAAALTVTLAWGLRHLAAGRAIYATGSNREAARLAGLHTAAVTLAVFALAGGLTGLAALLNSVRFNQIPSNAGLGLELKVIAAVVVGGTAITGGRGSVAGTVLGVDPARRHRPGADVPRRQRVLGARDSGRDHPRRGRARRVARPAGDAYRRCDVRGAAAVTSRSSTLARWHDPAESGRQRQRGRTARR